jgi:hypothetical protein
MLIFTLGLLYLFFILVVVARPPIAIEGVHWVKDEPKFVYKVDGCDASYIAKYNLVWHLRAHHNVTMELGKPRCPSIQEEPLRLKIMRP